MFGVTVLLVAVSVGWAAEPDGAADAHALAKASQNPVADLVSVPLQLNTNFGVGPDDRQQVVLNVQPVVPIKVAANWNVILRFITPFITQPIEPTGTVFGLGDVNPSLFLSPSRSERLVWGAGVTALVPTATDPVLGREKLGLGPTGVALASTGPWVVGALANNIWSVDGADHRDDVNQLLVQGFVNYNFSHGWAVVTAPIVTADWERDVDRRWVVPVGGGITKIAPILSVPTSLGVQYYYNVVTPEDGPTWQLRLQCSFLFPAS